MPISFPTFSKMAIARSSCSVVCPAVTMQRTRPVPLGTVGNTIGPMNKPFSKSFLENSRVFASSPMMTGVIGVSLCPVLKPR